MDLEYETELYEIFNSSLTIIEKVKKGINIYQKYSKKYKDLDNKKNIFLFHKDYGFLDGTDFICCIFMYIDSIKYNIYYDEYLNFINFPIDNKSVEDIFRIIYNERNDTYSQNIKNYILFIKELYLLKIDIELKLFLYIWCIEQASYLKHFKEYFEEYVYLTNYQSLFKKIKNKNFEINEKDKKELYYFLKDSEIRDYLSRHNIFNFIPNKRDSIYYKDIIKFVNSLYID